MTRLLDNLYLHLKSSPNNIEDYVTDDLQWHVSAPINTLYGKTKMLTDFWQPLGSVNLSGLNFIQFKTNLIAM